MLWSLIQVVGKIQFLEVMTEVLISSLSARCHSQCLESICISKFVMPETCGMEVATQKWSMAKELLRKRRIREEACV